MNDLDFLKEITSIYSGSGKENELADFLAGEFSALSYKAEKDDLGNLIVKNYEGNDCDILIDAHIDEIGFVVTEVLEGGFLKAASVGGIDERCVQSQPIEVKGEKDYFGVVSSVPPHLGSEEKLPKVEELYIDLGMTEKPLVSVGDRAYFKTELAHKGNRVTAGALDNKISVLALYKTAKMLEKTDKKVAFLFSSREEVGGQGAEAGAFSLNARSAVVVDVSFGYLPGSEKRECGILGKGPMIGFSPILSGELSKRAAELSEKANIPYQKEVLGGRTGTNADKISVSAAGVPTVTVSIPIFNMHTPVETADLSDVENTAKLLGLLAEV